ncbi:MAG: hypothetical protein ACR2PS_01385, partial [Pseudomonadales bacterium]
DQSVQRSLTTLLDEFDATGLRVLRSGLVFHATEGAQLARSEISTVGAGSLLGIVLLVMLIFRSVWALLSIAIVLLASSVFAIATCLLVFDKLHLVTLAFGSTLLGLAADYCFHFFSKWRASGDAMLARDLVSRGVLLSLASSAIAYLLQMISPFPGLQQFAVFITAGLLMACFTVLLVLPRLLAGKDLGGLRLSGLFNSVVLPLYRGLAVYRWPVISLLLVAQILALAWVARQGVSDDIRLLNTSGDTLLTEERRVGELIEGINSQQFFIVKGNTQQEMLEATEQLSIALASQLAGQVSQAAGEDSVISTSLFSVAQFVPSLAQQRQDYRLIQDKIYGPDGALAALCRSGPSLCEQNKPEPLNFQSGLVPSHLTPELQQDLKLNALLADSFTIVLPLGDVLDAEPVVQLANGLDAVDYVDNVQQLTGVLAQLRTQVSLILIGFILCLACASLYLFGRNGWPLIFSLLITVILSLAVATADGLTLFHVLALLLVMGLTVDTSIFYIKLGFDLDTWLAAALSCGTSLLAFGLLSFSQVAVLEQFGSVVFWGLICAWLLTPMVFCLMQNENNVRTQYA